MPTRLIVRSAVLAFALVALASTAGMAVAQANDNDPGRKTSPSDSTRPSSASNPSSSNPSSSPTRDNSQTGSGQAGYNTGQDDATPGSSTSGNRSGASTPNCATVPANAAECPQQSR